MFYKLPFRMLGNIIVLVQPVVRRATPQTPAFKTKDNYIGFRL